MGSSSRTADSPVRYRSDSAESAATTVPARRVRWLKRPYSTSTRWPTRSAPVSPSPAMSRNSSGS